MTIPITNPAQVIYVVPFPIDYRFSTFINGIIMNEGDEFAFGPGPNEITMLIPLSIGDLLEFRKI